MASTNLRTRLLRLSIFRLNPYNNMTHQKLLLAVFVSSLFTAQGQIFVYDQESVTSDTELGASGYNIQTEQPIGQSFTPELSSVGFVRLYVQNGQEMPIPSATVYINLLADSITGPVLGQSELVTLPGGQFTDTPLNFFFANPVAVTPGVTYYLQPVAESNPAVAYVIASGYLYSGGTLFLNGEPNPQDLWFREGIVVPEPSPSWLALLGSGVWFYLRNRKWFRLSS